MISRRGFVAGALAAPFVTSTLSARAEQKNLRIAYSAVSHWAGSFTAQEQGFFAERGIDAEFVLTQVSSNVPAVLLSGSVEIGCLTPPTFFQAIEGGLPLRAVCGATISSPNPSGTDSAQVVVAKGSGISGPQDFAGRKVATPGFGSVLDIVFRAWLIKGGVDLASVSFSETAMPNLPDVLRGGTVDAVVVADPFLSRMVAGGMGEKMIFISETVPPGTLMTMYATTAEYAAQNKDVIEAFQASIQQANSFIEAGGENLVQARQAIGQYLKLPPQALANLPIADLQALVDQEQVTRWYDILEQQSLVTARHPADEIVLPLGRA